MDTLTYISGGNGQGKTTIADAIAYAFCGTPFWGDKSCDKLLNPECKEMKVEVQFVDEDGEVHTISRRRNGNNTTITMDTLQLRQTDVANVFADKDVFLSVLNPLYFIEKIASDGREFLQRLLPPVNEKDILELMGDSTKALLENESLLDPEFYVTKKREEIREIEDDCKYLDGQIDLLKSQRTDAEKKLDSVLERGKTIVERKSALEEKQYNGIDVEALKAKQSKIAESLSDDKRSRLLAKQAEIESRQYESKFINEAAKIKAELGTLSAEYNKLAGQLNDIKIGDKCPACHSEVTKSNYQIMTADIKQKLTSVCQQGNNLKAAYKELAELDKKSREKFAEFKNADSEKIAKELEELGTSDISEIAMLEDKIRLGNLSEEEYAELQTLIAQADDYDKEVALICETDKIPEKISAIEKSIKANENRKKEIQNLIYAVGEFAAKKAEIVLNQLKMNRAAIKLFDVVKTTGEIKNVFKFTYDGKDYRWLSTSEKIKAGLEVSNLLAKLTGLIYPTYIDNAECITTKLDSVCGQVILAYARNTELTVQLPRRQKEQVKEAA